MLSWFFIVRVKMKKKKNKLLQCIQKISCCGKHDCIFCFFFNKCKNNVRLQNAVRIYQHEWQHHGRQMGFLEEIYQILRKPSPCCFQQPGLKASSTHCKLSDTLSLILIREVIGVTSHITICLPRGKPNTAKPKQNQQQTFNERPWLHSPMHVH